MSLAAARKAARAEAEKLAAGVDPRVARRQEEERQRVARWLASHRAPEGSRKRGKRIARPAVLGP